MALTFSLPQSLVGVPFADAYARISNFEGDRDGVHYHVAVHANRDAREGKSTLVAQYVFWCPTPVGNLYPALYEHLKSQPGFEAAKDC